VSEPRAVATGSGRAARFVSDRFAVILFREVFVFDSRKLPDPVATARGSDTLVSHGTTHRRTDAAPQERNLVIRPQCVAAPRLIVNFLAAYPLTPLRGSLMKGAGVTQGRTRTAAWPLASPSHPCRRLDNLRYICQTLQVGFPDKLYIR